MDTHKKIKTHKIFPGFTLNNEGGDLKMLPLFCGILITRRHVCEKLPSVTSSYEISAAHSLTDIQLWFMLYGIIREQVPSELLTNKVIIGTLAFLMCHVYLIYSTVLNRKKGKTTLFSFQSDFIFSDCNTNRLFISKICYSGYL